MLEDGGAAYVTVEEQATTTRKRPGLRIEEEKGLRERNVLSADCHLDSGLLHKGLLARCDVVVDAQALFERGMLQMILLPILLRFWVIGKER